MVRRLTLSLLLGLVAAPALAQSFVEETIGSTPGFASALDSGPARLSTSVIQGQLDALIAEAQSDGCTAEVWAGTWARRRSPRLQGATETGAEVAGPSITDGAVDGVPFHASLASGGQIEGETEAGTELRGHFARLGSARSIWYGVERDCSIAPAAATSCAALLADGNTTDGLYSIDPDGPGGIEPFDAWCDMTNQGGGWTLFASHADGIASVSVADPVTPEGLGVLAADRWQAVRDNMQDGMMFVDEAGRVSAISAAKLDASTCHAPSDVADLSDNQVGVLELVFHSENSGCSVTGVDYTLALLAGSAYGGFETAGASVYQLGNVDFDVWPYAGPTSFPEQNELLYYVR